MQQPVGENVTAFEIGAELDLVDGEEGHLDIGRHGLDGRHPEAGSCRNDLLFAGHKRHGVVADANPDPVIDLTREKAQWQPDHAARVGQHALDGEMGLAGIGGAENGGDATGGRHSVDLHLMPARARVKGPSGGEISASFNRRIQRRTNPVRITDQAPIQALFRRLTICFAAAIWTPR